MHITFDLFVDIREEKWIVEKLLHKFVEIYFVFVSFYKPSNNKIP